MAVGLGKGFAKDLGAGDDDLDKQSVGLERVSMEFTTILLDENGGLKSKKIDVEKRVRLRKLIESVAYHYRVSVGCVPFKWSL